MSSRSTGIPGIKPGGASCAAISNKQTPMNMAVDLYQSEPCVLSMMQEQENEHLTSRTTSSTL